MRRLLIAFSVAILATQAVAQTRLDADGMPVVPPAYGVAPPKAAPAPVKPLVTDAEVEADKRRITQRSTTLRDLHQAQDEVDQFRRANLERQRQEQQALLRSQLAASQSFLERILFLRFELPVLLALAGVAGGALLGIVVLLVRLFGRRQPPPFRRAEEWPRFQDLRTSADAAGGQPARFSLAEFMSAWERGVFHELRAAVPEGWYVCPQVRVADFVRVEPDAGSRAALNQLAPRSVDFVLIDAGTVPRLVIELDDRTHDRPDRRKRDADLDAVYEAVGLPVAHVRPGPSPDWGALIARATGWAGRDDRDDEPLVVLRGCPVPTTL